MVLKHTHVPRWLAEVLGIFPYIYLGLAILFAATGAGFIICQYDPFVGFFRFGASFNMIIFGVSLLITRNGYCPSLLPFFVSLWRFAQLDVRFRDAMLQSRRQNVQIAAYAKNLVLLVQLINRMKGNWPEGKKISIRRLVILFSLLPVIVHRQRLDSIGNASIACPST